MYEIHLVELAQKYGAHRRISLSRVGALTAADGKFFARLNAGRTCTVRLANTVLRWFADHWPADLPWPDGIDRPAPSPESPAARPAGCDDTPDGDLASAGGGDPAARCAALRSRSVDALMEGRLDAAGALRAEMLGIALRLDADTGALACPPALLAALGCERREYDYVCHRYRDGGAAPAGRPRGEMARAILALLVEAGDARFAARRLQGGPAGSSPPPSDAHGRAAGRPPATAGAPA